MADLEIFEVEYLIFLHLATNYIYLLIFQLIYDYTTNISTKTYHPIGTNSIKRFTFILL